MLRQKVAPVSESKKQITNRDGVARSCKVGHVPAGELRTPAQARRRYRSKQTRLDMPAAAHHIDRTAAAIALTRRRRRRSRPRSRSR